MRILEASQIRQIERALGRPLAPTDLVYAAALADLPEAIKSNAVLIARASTPLAVMYLNELIPGVQISDAMRFLERLGAAR